VTRSPSDQLRLTLWGVRGSIPTPVAGHLGYGGNTLCMEVRCPGLPPIIVEGGSGIRELGLALAREFPTGGECHIFFTHFHWDHIQGVPFFVPIYDSAWRVNFHSVHEPEVLENYLMDQMRAPYFPVAMPAVQATRTYTRVPEEGLRMGDLRVTRFPLNHPNGAHGYRVDAAGHAIVFAFDHEHGNAAVDRGIIEHAAGADVLIYDSQYTVEEYETRKGWGHSTGEQAAHIAKAAGVGQLVLIHHDPTHSDDVIAGIVDEARKLFPNTLGATEGWSVSFAAEAGQGLPPAHR
jgi:phosphoribosyl 1,2-cyclic phosphodiesterase